MKTTDLFGRELKNKPSSASLVSPCAENNGFRAPSARTRRDVKTQIEHGDCLEILRRLIDEGVQCDSCVTDPQYHMTATTKRFGQTTSAPARGEAAARLSKGFMGQKWDGGDIAFQPDTWRLVYDVLRPGAFLLAFGGTRTYHRLVCAIEDAGFVIQDSILDLVASDTRIQQFLSTLSPSQIDAFSQIMDDTQPSGLLAWVYGSGFPKRRDMLKPAWEPIVMAYKPGGGRTLQVDECRVAASDGYKENDVTQGVNTARTSWEPQRQPRKFEPSQFGRWPANLCHDGSEEVTGLFPDSKGSVGEFRRVASKDYTSFVQIAGRSQDIAGVGHGDSGSAARFFYTAKADADERAGSKHPTVKPTDLMQWLVRLVTPYGGTVIDPFAGTGSTGAAAILEGVDSILIERDDVYIQDIMRKINQYTKRRSRTLY